MKVALRNVRQRNRDSEIAQLIHEYDLKHLEEYKDNIKMMLRLDIKDKSNRITFVQYDRKTGMSQALMELAEEDDILLVRNRGMLKDIKRQTHKKYSNVICASSATRLIRELYNIDKGNVVMIDGTETNLDYSLLLSMTDKRYIVCTAHQCCTLEID